MSDLLAAVNRLLAAALEHGAVSGDAVRVHTVRLHEGGAQVTGTVHHALAEGAFEIHLRVEPERDGRQAVRLHAVRLPEHMAPLLEAFREVLSRSEVRLELDFSGGDAPGAA